MPILIPGVASGFFLLLCENHFFHPYIVLGAVHILRHHKTGEGGCLTFIMFDDMGGGGVSTFDYVIFLSLAEVYISPIFCY